MKKYFDFNGLAGREEFWAVYVIGFVIGFLAVFISSAVMIGSNSAGPAFWLLALLWIALLWLQVATGARRCRKAGINVYWCLTLLVPYVNFAAMIAFGVLPDKIEE